MSLCSEQLVSGYTLSCRSTPGVKNVYLANIENVTGFTLSSGNIVTGITMVANKYFYRFTSPKFTSSFEEKPIINQENGVLAFAPEIKFKLLRRTTDLRNMLLTLGNSKMLAIVENQDGRYWLVGATTTTSPDTDNGLELTQDTNFTTGIAQDSFAGLEVAMNSYQDVPCYEISSSIISAITSD